MAGSAPALPLPRPEPGQLVVPAEVLLAGVAEPQPLGALADAHHRMALAPASTLWQTPAQQLSAF